MFENVNGRMTPTAGPWVSYKLTGEPLAQEGSGELTIHTKSADQFV